MSPPICDLSGVLFDYNTPQIVTIHSRKVGIINRLIQLAIIGYIIGYVVIYQKGYQKVDSVQGAVTTKVKGVVYTNFTKVPGLEGRIWDVADYVVPPQENGAFFVATNVLVTPLQVQGICDEDPTISDGNCTINACEAHQPVIGGNGIKTGRCVNSTVEPGAQVCEIYAWCPVEQDDNTTRSPTPALAASQNFTVFIKNNIEFPKFNVQRRNIIGFNTNDELSNCRFDPNDPVNKLCPIFLLSDIMKRAGADTYKLAESGGIIQIIITWNCDLDLGINSCLPEYAFRSLDNADYKIFSQQNYVVIYQKGYQKVDSVQGAVTTKVKGVVYTNFTKVPGLEGRIWDVADYVVPPQENGAFFIATNVLVTPLQVQGICDEDPTISDGNCTINACEAHQPVIGGNGIKTGRCVNSTVEPGAQVCEIYAWCPVEQDDNTTRSPTPALAASQNFTVFIKNNIEFPKFNVQRRNIIGFNTNDELSNCRFDPNDPVNKLCPIFLLSDIMKRAGADTYKLAESGGIIQIIITWNCDLDLGINSCLPEYAFRSLDNADYKIFSQQNYVVIYQKGYQKVDSVQGAVTTKVKGVVYTNFTKVPGLEGRIWDVADYVVPPQENGAFFVATNVLVTPLQVQGICDEDPTISDGNCTINACEAHQPVIGGNGIKTGRCVNSTVEPGAQVCEIYAWCPVEQDDNTTRSPTPALAASQNFTVFIKNNIEFPKFNVQRRNIIGFNKNDELSNCRFDPNDPVNKLCPIFLLSDIMKRAGADTYKLAESGGIIQIIITWNCDLDLGINSCLPEYAFRSLDNAEYKISSGYNFRYADHFLENGIPSRTLYKMFGIRFIITVEGTASKFALEALVLKLGSCIALLAIANVLSDIIVLYILKAKNFYWDKKFVSVTGDDAYQALDSGQSKADENASQPYPVVINTSESYGSISVA